MSWTLSGMSTGEELFRSFTVRVDNDLVSGTQIFNDDYGTSWYELEASAVFSNSGVPVTTTVREVGLIDSYKEVTPALALPGPGNMLTYYLHIVNSSPVPLNGVKVYDYLPWESTTYQRDAQVSSGTIVSDIVSLEWRGNIDAFSEGELDAKSFSERTQVLANWSGTAGVATRLSYTQPTDATRVR